MIQIVNGSSKRHVTGQNTPATGNPGEAVRLSAHTDRHKVSSAPNTTSMAEAYQAQTLSLQEGRDRSPLEFSGTQTTYDHVLVQ